MQRLHLYVAVEAWRGVVQDAYIFKNWEDVVAWAKGFVEDDPEYLKALLETGEFPETTNYDQTKIFEMDIDVD